MKHRPPPYQQEIAVVRAAIGALLSAVDVLVLSLESLNNAMIVEKRAARGDVVQRAVVVKGEKPSM